MRAAIAEAEVGDEQRFDDPTVNALQERVADAARQGGRALPALGHDVQRDRLPAPPPPRRRRGDPGPHVAPGAVRGRRPGGALAGDAPPRSTGAGGIFTAAQVSDGAVARPATATRRARGSSRSSRRPTSAAGGCGRWRAIERGARRGREHGLRAHLDGARLMNAVVASGVPAADYARRFDTAWIDFTKGLGAPVGACLAGSRELIDEAWRYKQMLGGAMRQAGIVAAAGLYALDHHVDRLAEDHANARAAGRGAGRAARRPIDPATVETNIVIFERGRRAGVLRGLAGRRRADGPARRPTACARSRTSTSTRTASSARSRQRRAPPS